MTDRVFCYHCRSHHARHEMVLVQSARGKRWRCRKSAAFGRQSQERRDAFGRAVSETNRAIEAWRRHQTVPHPVRETFCPFLVVPMTGAA